MKGNFWWGAANMAGAVFAVFCGWHYLALVPAAIGGALLFTSSLQYLLVLP